MKRAIAWILILMLLAAGLAVGEEARGLQRDVLVLFTSDVHCGVDQGFGYAGLQMIRDAAEKAGNHVMLVDNGDSIQGEALGLLSQGRASIDLMNAMGYDVAVPGNHEFNYGVERFLDLAQAAAFPYVSCNFSHGDALVFEPYILREFDGVRVAFVGICTPETMLSTTPRFFQDESGRYVYDFAQGEDGSRLYAAVQQAVDDARAEGADYVIALAHLGMEGSAEPYTYADVIGHTSGIDAMLDGHSHDSDKVEMKDRDGKTVLRQACGTKLSGIGWLRISAADGGVSTGLYSWSNDVSAPELLGIDNRMSQAVEEATEDLRRQLAEVVGSATVTLTISSPHVADDSGRPIRLIRRTETNLGDLVADALRAYTGAEIAFANGGAVRASVPAGSITLNDVMTVLPWGNRIVILEATGRQILNALEFGASAWPEESGAFLQVSGLTYEIDGDIPSSVEVDENGFFKGVSGAYRVGNVMVGGEPLDLERTYTVGGTDYSLVDHGDGQTAFDGCSLVKDLDMADYEVLASYIREELNGVIGSGYEDPYGTGRIAINTEE